MKKLFQQTDPADGCVTRLEEWPEGLVLWHDGVVAWREWGPRARRVDEPVTPSEAELYQAAIEIYGQEPQMTMVVEEAAELILAVVRRSRGRTTPADLASECADVEIMIGQVRQIIGPRLVNHAKQEKLARLESRLRLRGFKGSGS